MYNSYKIVQILHDGDKNIMRKNGSLSIATLVLIIIALFIPTYIAIAVYMTGPDAEYEKTQNEIVSLTVTDFEGNVYSYKRADGDASAKMIRMFNDIFDGAQQVTTLTDAITATPAYTVKTRTKNGEHGYRFYFNMKGASYYSDDKGNSFGISEATAAPFFSSECAVVLFYKTPAPVFKTSLDTPVTPSEMSWLYLGHTGDYSPIKTDTTTEIISYDLGGNFDFSFDITPDNTKVTVTADEQTIYTGTLENMSTIGEIKKGVKYRIEISAEWFKDKERNYCGSAKYILATEIESDPIEISLSETSLEAGQIGVINVRNVTDPSHIKVVFTPALKYKGEAVNPVFYGADGSYSALFPIPESCFTDNGEKGSSMKYTVDVSYGATQLSIDLNIAKRSSSTDKKTGDAKKADITNLRTDEALKAFSDLRKSLASKTAAEKLWKSDRFYKYYSQDIKFANAFGKIWSLTTGISYTNEFIQYQMKATKDIISVNDGVVVDVGENDYLGKYIVVDHGLGLQTWYLHLSSASVKTGDAVANKQIIGKSGNTGFLEDSKIGFAMMYTVNGVPVCPYALDSGKGLEETGLKVEAFAQ